MTEKITIITNILVLIYLVLSGLLFIKMLDIFNGLSSRIDYIEDALNVIDEVVSDMTKED